MNIENEIIIAIQMRICYIETSTTHMRAVDAEVYNQSLTKPIPAGSRKGVPQYRLSSEKPIAVHALNRNQRELINALEDYCVELRSK